MNETARPNPDDPTRAAPPSGADSPHAPWPDPAAGEFLASHEQTGATLGRYKLLEKIGEGGFGVVYVAEQKEPVRRRVALKIIKLGMDTRSVVARFEAERQALAMMDHPNIAKVFDAGATDTGRPYFVMEFVRGIRITDYCDQNKLSTRERLELFIMVCHAIQHAHQKGIIHRDIKPSNILITLHDGVPVPKVIDFGIAKATQQDLTDKTLYTQLQQFIGTPAYMSPEQAEMSGLDIDTRSDIYSLGVLLYELLTGRTPFDGQELVSLGVDAMRIAIREKEPTKPSSKLATLQNADLSTTADRHAVEAPKLIRLLKGDLDWIVMKCLEKDRTRRYETANGLAVDIKRHLNNESIFARPPSSTYRLQKLVRRNKLAFGAAAAVLFVLLLGIIVSTWQAVRATRAQVRESEQRQMAETNESKARDAEAGEAAARAHAQAQELIARRRAYASDMNVAMEALHKNNLGRAQDLLDRQRPQPGETDLRGWEWRYLWQQTRSDALYTICEKTEIESLAVSADGRWLAIGIAQNDGLFIWDLQTRQEVAHLAPGQSGVRGIFSPTEPLLAYTAHDKGDENHAHLYFWNAATRQPVADFSLPGRSAGLAFSADGRTFVCSIGGQRTQITLWRVSDHTPIDSYPTEQFTIDTLADFAASSDLSVAAYGLEDGRIRVVDLHNGRELWSAAAAQHWITALAFSPDGKTLASAAGFGESDIRLWDVASGKEIGRLQGHASWVGALVFWPDGKKLASASADQTIRTWDVSTRTCTDVLRGHRLEVWRLALLPDNRTLVSGCKDGTVCLWDTSVTHPRRENFTLTEMCSNWRFAPDGRSIVTVNSEGQVVRWSGSDFQRKEPVLETGIKNTLRYSFHDGYCFSGDERLLACGSRDGTVAVWDLSRQALACAVMPAFGAVYPELFLSQGQRLIIYAESEDRLIEWDIAANRQIQSWAAPPAFQSVGLSRDERQLVAVGHAGDVLMRNLGQQSSSKPPVDIPEADGVDFTPSAQLLAGCSDLGFARVWDTATWREVATLKGFLNAVDSVAFSPDGSRLAIAASKDDEAVKLWTVDSWQEVLTLRAQGHRFASAAFSPDGNAIGVVTELGVVTIWQAPSWEEIIAAEAAQNAKIKTP